MKIYKIQDKIDAAAFMIESGEPDDIIILTRKMFNFIQKGEEKVLDLEDLACRDENYNDI